MHLVRRLILALAFMAAGAAAALVLAGRMRVQESAEAGRGSSDTAPASQSTRPSTAQPRLSAAVDFSDVAERTVGGVTNISSLQPARRPMVADDPFFRYFFGDQDLSGWERRPQSLGSGVIVSSDGYLLTNTHVVGSPNADVTVVLADKRELPAKVVGVDAVTDIAVLKIDGRNLPTIPWGDSSRLKIAEWVLAIGNPYQLSQTVTLGIVSAIGRSLQGRVAGYEDFIQTDAAINPGNSGGALINAQGELIGINTAIFSQSGGYQGIGFAVPSNLARRIMNDLIKYGTVRRGWIGLGEIVPVTTDVARRLGVPAGGVLVYSLYRDSPAWDAAIRAGDVITSVNGKPIDDASILLRTIADSPIDGTLTLGVIQDGERRELKVRVEQQRQPQRRRAF
jgi:Do/DeqQ family serine protease